MAKAMVEETTKFIRIDLNHFKLHLYLKPEVELTLHFDSPSRRFYLSVIGLVVYEMKKRGRITSIPLQEHLDVLALLNKTVGMAAGSSKSEHLLPRIYRKWKDALPDLENAPLFKVVGRKKRYDELMEKVYGFSAAEKDCWANLFEYKGSHEHVRLRFSIDRLNASLDDVIIVFGEYPELANVDAWKGFIAHLREKPEDKSISERADGELKVPELPPLRQRRWLRAVPDRWQWPTLCALIILIVGVSGLAVWKNNLFTPQVEVGSAGKLTIPLPDRPSLAVLPFDNLSGDKDQDYVADGLTENIIDALAKIPEMFLAARHSTFTYKGKQLKIRQIAEELGVQYVLEGSIQKSGERLRVTAQLIDALKGHHVWSQKYDRKLKDLFAVQDNITLNIAIAMELQLTEGEQARMRHSTDSLEAWSLASKGKGLFETYRMDDNLKARELFKGAVELDPNYAYAWVYLAWTHFIDGYFFFSHYDRKESFQIATEIAQKALNIDDNLSDAYALISFAYLTQRKFDEALAAGKKAIALGPNDSENHAIIAIVMQYLGDGEAVINLIKKAMRLDPHFPSWYWYRLSVGYRLAGRYEEAVATLEAELKRIEKEKIRQSIRGYLIELATTYVMMGRMEEAKACVAKVLEINPKTSIEEWRQSQLYKDPEYTERILEALRKAGLTEKPTA